MKQPCIFFGKVSRFPHEFTTPPSGSNSITGGAGLAIFASLGHISPRLRTKMWSAASAHTPPSSPKTHLLASGLGQNGSTLKVGPTTGTFPVWPLISFGKKLHTASERLNIAIMAVLHARIFWFITPPHSQLVSSQLWRQH